MELRKQFQQILNVEFKLDTEKKILIAVSGGVDSMVLLDLFVQSEYKVGLAHINHRLRGTESDADADFVKSFAQAHNISYFSEEIPKEYWNDHKNKHEAARQFRYSFFEKCADKNNYHFIATAHHKDDDLETFFIRMKRGTGLTGLAGIPRQRNNIIRPLLSFSKKEILSYAKINGVLYREDSSNERSEYTRNYLRNEIFPLLDKMEIKGREGLYHSLTSVKEDIDLFHELLEKYVSGIRKVYDFYIVYDLGKLKEINAGKTLLAHIFLPCGFNDFQCSEMMEPHEENCFWLSHTHRIDLDKNMLYLTERTLTESGVESDIFLNKDISTISSIGDTYETRSCDSQCSDHRFKIGFSVLVFPLIIRPWSPNDTFYPATMKGKKKDIRKVISENKVPHPLRKNVQVLVNGDGRLIAVLPYLKSWHFVKNETEDAFLDVRRNGKSILYPDIKISGQEDI